jgi:hypothetical protein
MRAANHGKPSSGGIQKQNTSDHLLLPPRPLAPEFTGMQRPSDPGSNAYLDGMNPFKTRPHLGQRTSIKTVYARPFQKGPQNWPEDFILHLWRDRRYVEAAARAKLKFVARLSYADPRGKPYTIIEDILEVVEVDESYWSRFDDGVVRPVLSD